MELDLIPCKNENLGVNEFFKLEYKNQDVKNKPEFKKWYKNTKEYINKENLKRSNVFMKPDFNEEDYKILIIEFCRRCMSYTISSIHVNSFCYARCNKCKQNFCIGCLRDLNNSCCEDVNSSICLKGYLKGFYLRIIYRRSIITETNTCYIIMHIILCLFMTPLYLGFLSNFIGSMAHPNKNRENIVNEDLIYIYGLLSFLIGFLMFPYIIFFFPFMVILLLPGIFSYRYYLYIFNIYATALMPGIHSLKTEDN